MNEHSETKLPWSPSTLKSAARLYENCTFKPFCLEALFMFPKKISNRTEDVGERKRRHQRFSLDLSLLLPGWKMGQRRQWRWIEIPGHGTFYGSHFMNTTYKVPENVNEQESTSMAFRNYLLRKVVSSDRNGKSCPFYAEKGHSFILLMRELMSLKQKGQVTMLNRICWRWSR